MSHSSDGTAIKAQVTRPLTLNEIFQQPALWPTTVRRIRDAMQTSPLMREAGNSTVLISGAGSSAHAASAVSAVWPRSLAVPSTDLLVDAEPFLKRVDGVVSLARSGESPESAGVVNRIRVLRPKIWQIAVVCNEDSALLRSGLDGFIGLDPRTNDQSLVMTSAFSNLVLAGMCLAAADQVAGIMPEATERSSRLLSGISDQCREVATQVVDRIVILSSSPMLGWAREAGLKAMEMTSGRFPVVTETYLGLRHGPMSFLRSDTLVLCLLSNDPMRRRYEIDLIRELHSKNLGYLVGIADPEKDRDLFDTVIPAILPSVPDTLRTPFEIVTAQLIGYHLSLRVGMNPDNPSPGGIIRRVVQGFRIHSGDQDSTSEIET